MHRLIIPRWHVDMVVPGRRDIGVRSLKDHEYFGIFLKYLPQRIHLRHMPVDEESFVVFHYFHQQVTSGWLLAIVSHQRRKFILLEKFKYFFTIFFTIQF